MASERAKTTLGALGSLRNGLNFNREQEGVGLAVLKVKDFGDLFFAPDSGYDELDPKTIRVSEHQYLQPGDTVIIRSNGNIAMVGRSLFFRGSTVPLAFSGFCIRFRPDPAKVHARFAAYLIRSPFFRQRFSAYGSGTGIQNLSQEILSSVPVSLPDLKEQEKIAGILAAFDDKIELIRKMNEALEAMARMLFKSWFVDFDPVRAKADGRDTGLPAPVAAIFSDSFEESSLGEIPTGWTVEPIGNLTDVIGGTTPSTKEPEFWEPDTHAWATPKDLSNLRTPVLLKTERRVSDKGMTQIGSGLLPIGTVLLSSRAPIGYLAVAEIPVAINQGFIAMKAKEGVSNLFLLYWAEVAQETIKSRANGSTFLEISKSNFRQIEVVRPDGAVMKKFDAYVRPWYRRIVANEHETATLITMRDALLPKLISGEIRIDPTEGEG